MIATQRPAYTDAGFVRCNGCGLGLHFHPRGETPEESRETLADHGWSTRKVGRSVFDLCPVCTDD